MGIVNWNNNHLLDLITIYFTIFYYYFLLFFTIIIILLLFEYLYKITLVIKVAIQ